MTEKELIKKIRQLRQIEPRKNWVIFSKEQVLGQELNREQVPVFSIFQHKFAFAYLAVVVIFVGVLGTFGLAQNSLPGDSLYFLKKITEKSQAIFVSEENQPRHNLEIVNKRLDDLTKIAETNKINNLASAIKEVQESEEQAVESLNNPEVKKDPKQVEKIVIEIKKAEEKKQELREVYGVAGLEEYKEINSTIKIVVEWLIEDIESRSLIEEQEESLAEAKQEYEEGDYSQALEILYLMSQ